MAAPTSTNEVTARKFSSSISALWTKIKSTFQTLGNLVTTSTGWGSTPSDTKYPSEKLVKDSLDGKQATLAFDGTYNASTNKAATVSTVTNAIGGLDVSSVGGNGKYISAISETDGKISATATTMDTTPTADSTKAVTSGGIKTALGNYVPFSYKILDTNPFGGKHLYLNYIGNAMYSMDKRYFVTATFHEKVVDGVEYPRIKPGASITDDVYYEDSPVVSTVTSSLRTLFNGYYDSGIAIASGKYLKIHIQFSNEENWTPATGRVSDYEYNYGDYFLSFYFSNVPSGAKWRCYNTYAQHTIGWKQGDFSYYAGNASSANSVILTARDANNHKRTCIEFIVFPKDSVNANLTQIDWCLDRPTLSKTFPFFTNFADQNSYVDWYFKQKVNSTATIEIKGSDGSIKAKSLTLTETPLPVSSGGTGKTTAKAAEYNLTTGKSEISDTTSGDDRVVFELASPSESNGVTRGFRKLSTIWTWIKGLLSSESGVNISGSSASCTGNAETATKATQDSDGNTINATYFKSSGNTTLVAGAATKIGTQNGADVKLTLPAHQDISGKMNTSASNATAPSGSGGDGATATLLNNLTEGNSDIVTTDDGDNVLIATTENGGSVTNKWYKRKLVKLIPWIIKKLGTRLVYDCGAGSTSGDDFDAALAAFNAGQWVIIHDSANVYYCAGTYNSGLRFKRLTNSASGISVNTLNWTRGSSPSAGSQLDASLSGHTHTRSDITNFAHTHGNITNDGGITASGVDIANGDSLVIVDSSETNKLVAKTSVTFNGSTTTKALTQKGTFETFMTPSAGNATSGALQNLTAQLTEGTSDFTDNTEIFTSYAGNNGFAESGHVNQPYRRKASSMLNYVRDWFAIDRSPANVGTTHKRISLGYGKYSSSNYVGAMTYIVRLFFNYADDGGLRGKGITVLVTYDFRRSGTQKSECRILSDNGVRDAGYNVVLANYVSGSGDNGKLYICIGLVKNSAPTTLVEFNYSYCKIFRVGTVGDWVQSISSDAVGTYDYIIQATDLVSNAVNADMVDGKHIVIGSWAGASNTIYFG